MKKRYALLVASLLLLIVLGCIVCIAVRITGGEKDSAGGIHQEEENKDTTVVFPEDTMETDTNILPEGGDGSGNETSDNKTVDNESDDIQSYTDNESDDNKSDTNKSEDNGSDINEGESDEESSSEDTERTGEGILLPEVGF